MKVTASDYALCAYDADDSLIVLILSIFRMSHDSALYIA